MTNDAADISILLQEYVDAIRPTDRLPQDDLRPVMMGLFGEVGSIMAPAKKLHREKAAYVGYLAAVEEEFGDTLWYLAALARRTGNRLPDIFSRVAETTEDSTPTIDRSEPDLGIGELDNALFDLGTAAAALLSLRDDRAKTLELLCAFAQKYLNALTVSKISISRVVVQNVAKTRGRFLEPDPVSLPIFDQIFDEEERLPTHFEIKIVQRKSGQSWLQWNGVFIGDPLTDNILDPDGYRFHDVFHFAHAAVLGWSPTFRSLIRHKRKSDRVVDEAQDGGRAIVVEEGLTAWLFTRAKELNFFEDQKSVSFDLLKIVRQFVQGYEVETCPLKLWENAILQGYDVFRQVRANQGGTVIGDRKRRMIAFQPLTLSKS